MPIQLSDYNRAQRERKAQRRRSEITSAMALCIVTICVLVAGAATFVRFHESNPDSNSIAQYTSAEKFGQIIRVEPGSCSKTIFDNPSGRVESKSAFPCRELDEPTDSFHMPSNRIEKIRKGFFNSQR